MNTLWVLGAPDPEMQTIEALLTAHGQAIAYACTREGSRVMPGSAYRATHAVDPQGQPVPLDEHSVAFVECDVPGVSAAVRVDHHRPGDPGYGQPPAQYWEASSVGQVAAALGVAPTPTLRMVAAADHCLPAAYCGECPGVDPGALMVWRIETRAAFQGRPAEAILADVARARTLLAAAPHITLGGVAVADLRVAKRTQHIPELPEAAVREGLCFVAASRDRATGREKIVLQGAPPAAVQEFLARAREFGAGEAYGDPARGFAGVHRDPAPVIEPPLLGR